MAQGAKTGGRTKGTPNRSTRAIRGVLVEMMNNEFEKIPDLLAKLEQEKRIEFLIKLMPYCLPKIQDVSQEWMFEEVSTRQ